MMAAENVIKAKPKKKITDKLDRSATFYALFGLFDSIDVSVSSIRYFCRAVSSSKKEEKEIMQALLFGNWHSLIWGMFVFSAGFALLSNFNYKQSSKNDANNYELTAWFYLRYLLKSSQYAFKSVFCILPLINHLKLLENLPYLTPLGLVMMVSSIISRLYLKHDLNELKKLSFKNRQLLHEMRVLAEINTPQAYDELIILINKINRVEDVSSKYKLMIYAAFSALIDKPNLFFSIMAITLLSPSSILIASGMFVGFLSLSIISNVYSALKKHRSYQTSQLKCEIAVLESVLIREKGNLANQDVENELALKKAKLAALKSPLLAESTITLLGQAIALSNQLPIRQVTFVSLQILALPSQYLFIGGGALLTVGTLILLASNSVLKDFEKKQQQGLITKKDAGYLTRFLLHIRDNCTTYIAISAMIFIGFLKGQKLANFSLKFLEKAGEDILSFTFFISMSLQAFSMIVLSLNRITEYFNASAPSDEWSAKAKADAYQKYSFFADTSSDDEVTSPMSPESSSSQEISNDSFDSNEIAYQCFEYSRTL